MKQPRFHLSHDAALDILEALPVGILLADPQGTVLWVNDALCAQFRCTASEILGRSRHELPAKRILTLFKGIETYHVAAMDADDDRWLSAMSRALDIEAASALEAVCTVDITHYERARKRRHLSLIPNEPMRIDAETGLLTEKSVMAHLVSEVSRSRRYQNPLSVIMLHLAAGQGGASEDIAMLPKVARFLKERLRWVDITGRWQHRGILVVLPETNLAAATQLANKLCAEMDKDLQAEAGDRAPLSPLAIGVTEWRKGDDAMKLIDRIYDRVTAPAASIPQKVSVA